MPDAKAANRHVRKAIRELIEPALRDLGFSGKYPRFQREFGKEVHFIEFYTQKYGGAFNYTGAFGRAGKVTDLAQTDFDDRASVVRMMHLCMVDGTDVLRSSGNFEYSYLGDDQQACRALVIEALDMLPTLDQWLKTRELAAGIETKGHRMRSGVSKETLWHLAAGMIHGFDLDDRPPSTPAFDAQQAAGLAPEYFPDP